MPVAMSAKAEISGSAPDLTCNLPKKAVAEAEADYRNSPDHEFLFPPGGGAVGCKSSKGAVVTGILMDGRRRQL